MNALSVRHRWYVTGGLMLTMFLAAVDGTIVATAMPAITADLRGFTLYPWVASIYLLVTSSTVPLYGKLADLYGRRGLLFAGILLFLAGSVLCGSAHSMLQLVVYRAFQGIGAGALLPISQTVVGDIYTREERARMQGYFGSVWGISAIIGPALGGFLVEALSWRWVFFLNVPVGLFAIAVLARYYRENVERSRHRVDYLGAAALMLGVSALMLGLLQARTLGWASWPIVLLFVLAAALLAAFVLQERRFPEPLLPTELFRNRVILYSNLAGLLTGAMIGVVSFVIPIFVTGVQGKSVALAGAAIAPVSIGWPIASTICGRLGLRVGFRATAILGMFLCGAAAIWFLRLGPGSPYAYLAAGSVTMGMGLGFSTTGFLIEVQNAVPWGLRGIATASQGFVRTLGSTIGLAVMGAVLYGRTVAQLAADAPAQLARLGGASGALDTVNRLLSPENRTGLAHDAFLALSGALTHGVRAVFWVTLVAAAGALVVVLQLPRGTGEGAQPPRGHAPAAAGAGGGGAGRGGAGGGDASGGDASGGGGSGAGGSGGGAADGGGGPGAGGGAQ